VGQPLHRELQHKLLEKTNTLFNTSTFLAFFSYDNSIFIHLILNPNTNKTKQTCTPLFFSSFHFHTLLLSNSSLWYHKRGVFVGRNSTRSKIWSCFCQQQLMRSNNVSFFTADLFYAKWVFLDSSYVNKDGVLNSTSDSVLFLLLTMLFYFLICYDYYVIVVVWW
jgi:hypothetical protein